MTDSNPPVLTFTGERFTPECVREIWYEHMHRYAFAAALAPGRRVLDAACGEGYGSALLAAAGAEVLGVDISPEAIAHAQSRYGDRANLRFAQADVSRLDGLAEHSFDLIVSFETLEHVHAQEAMLARFERLLAPAGVLLVSSPDKRTYSDLTGYRNEHHVRELYRDELEALLHRHFPVVRLLGQKLLFQSVLWDPDQAPVHACAATLQADGQLSPRLDYAPLYYLALCARAAADLPLPAGSVHCFGDAAESVYTHYNDEVRKHIAAGHRLMAQEREIDQLREELAQAKAQIAQLSHQGRNA
ncbi:MAG: class I SAM-dependent methyltransferase [Lysobacterales bacterium]